MFVPSSIRHVDSLTRSASEREASTVWNTIAFTCNFSQVPAYLLFLIAEFGVFLLLFAIYTYRKLVKEQARNSFEVTNICFVLISLILIFFVRSKGFNVFSYRGIMPAQVIVFLVSCLMLYEMDFRVRALKYLIYALLFIQTTGFIPELMAMTKDCYKKRQV